MHELGITRNIVAIVSENAGDRPVSRITLDIGKLSAIMPDAIRFCFDICSKNTPLENARLEINEIPGQGRCDICGKTIELEQPFGQCECGSRRITCIAGDEMKIREMEVM
ncbi:MAG: hydrogenase maturation nickel metallochaperone HypA [Nevskiales bacterium]|nr:hydrogenase maturation nickel metallochaperone HypA [Porticoccaceae bacterium]MBV60600.1 hydrogenase maturation nickel metallochaperone HypA [Nevskiales bacterium]